MVQVLSHETTTETCEDESMEEIRVSRLTTTTEGSCEEDSLEEIKARIP
jgi:hypothetical protein